MSYLVLARKYRPQTFAEITGQEHVTRTLTNAIEQQRVHHAFLFCGARGVGKTTAARVMAKALNCDHGPTPNPCGTCKPCTEIAASGSIDVYEIDGASNRGIGEIRELREGVAYAPQRDRHKIYIIDEVHMLTTEAFNALLKTLEEPPSHVKFIFATTEPHKIPITILSRCQRFDFKRIPLEVMIGRLSEILETETISVDGPSLRLIARESEGSMRDALSLTDRIISFAGDTATFDQVAEILGVADRGWLKEIVEAALERNAPKALAVVTEVFSYGGDIKQFSHDLVHYLRDIIMLRVAGAKTSLTDLSDQETETLASLGQNRQVADLQRLFSVAASTAEKLAQASFPRLELEMAVIRMCELRPLVPIDALLHRLEALERHLESGAPLPPPSTSGGPSGSPPPDGPVGPPPSTGGPSSGANATTSSLQNSNSAARSTADLGLAAPPHGSTGSPKSKQGQPSEQPAMLTRGAKLAPETTPAAPEDMGSPNRGEALKETTPAPDARAHDKLATAAEGKQEGAPEPADSEPPSSRSEPPEVDMAVQGAQAHEELRFNNDDWERFVDSLVDGNARLAAFLARGQVVGVSRRVVHVGFVRDAQSASTASTFLPQIARLLSKTVGGPARIQIELVEAVDDCPFERRERRHHEQMTQKRRALEKHPAVAEVVNRFNGTVRHVQAYDPREQHA